MKTTYKIINLNNPIAAPAIALDLMVGNFAATTAEVPAEISAKTLEIVQQDDRWICNMFRTNGDVLTPQVVCRHVYAAPIDIVEDFLLINDQPEVVSWLMENVFTENGAPNPDGKYRTYEEELVGMVYMAIVRASMSPEAIAESRDKTFEYMVTSLQSETDETRNKPAFITQTLEMIRVMDYSQEQANMIKALLPAA
jgi:hypothetical protein